MSWGGILLHDGRYRLNAPVGGQCVSYFLCGLFPAAQGRPPLLRGGPEPVPVALVVQPVGERGGQGSRIAGRDQLAGAGAIGGGAERFGQPADSRSYDGQAVGERFGDGHAIGLRAGRCDEQVGGSIRVAERRADQDAAEPDAVIVAEARDTRPQLLDEVRVAVERSGQHAVPVPVGELGECLDEEVLPLVGTQDSDADQVAGDGPGRGTCTRQAGIAYRVRTCRRVHSLVTTTPAAARSTARSERSALASWCVSRAVAKGMCSSTVIRIRPVWGSSCAAVGEAMSPSIRTVSPSGMAETMRARSARAPEPGTGHAAATVAIRTSQPASARPAQTRRS